MNRLGDIIGAVKENTETLIDANKEVGLEINAVRTRYMLLSRQLKIGRKSHKNS
jgi:hypothetical protein